MSDNIKVEARNLRGDVGCCQCKCLETACQFEEKEEFWSILDEVAESVPSGGEW